MNSDNSKQSAVEIVTDASAVDWEHVRALFIAVGWGERDVNDIERAFSKSTYRFFAYSEGKLIGFGRTTDDGVNYALICDLVVDPRYQGTGIGSRLLTELRNACSGFEFVTLTAAEGKDEFYLNQGWRRQSSSFIWPRDEEQARIHTKNGESS